LKIVFLEKQTVLVRAVDQKKIRPAVPVEIADADPATDKAGTVEPAQPMIHRQSLGELHTGLRRGQFFKQGRTLSPRSPFTQRFGHEGRLGSAIATHCQKQQANSPVKSDFAHRLGIRRSSGRICQCLQRSLPGQNSLTTANGHEGTRRKSRHEFSRIYMITF
jgi:hypothetical protein